MPASLVILSVIALVLYILFGYLLPGAPWPGSADRPYGRTMLAAFVIVLVLIFWYVLPIRVGP